MAATSIAPDGSTVLLIMDVFPENLSPAFALFPWVAGLRGVDSTLIADIGKSAIAGVDRPIVPRLPRRGCVDRARPAIPGRSLRSNWPRFVPKVRSRDGPWPAAPPACRRQSRARPALHPEAIDGARAVRPPRPRRPFCNRAH